jgi:hypothetical protein
MHQREVMVILNAKIDLKLFFIIETSSCYRLLEGVYIKGDGRGNEQNIYTYVLHINRI